MVDYFLMFGTACRQFVTGRLSDVPCGNEYSRLRACFGVMLALVLLSGCASAPRTRHDAGHAAPHHTRPATRADAGPVSATPALDLSAVANLEGIIPALAGKRVVLVGESHNRYDHHLVQLEIIQRLHAIHPRLAIGMEMFQQPFQDILDDYVAGRLSEQELLRGSEYYRRWRFDYRLYAPILRYAREHQLPVVALNLPKELTRKVGSEGLESLDEDERNMLPGEIDRSDAAYEERLRDIYKQHPGTDGGGFENFLDVQLLWDEGMAQQAADYLRAHPDDSMVILAGSGHLAYGSGIPRRLERRVPVPAAIVLNGWDGDLEPGLADYLLLTRERKLPASGKFGALLEEEDEMLTVQMCMTDSPCKAAGIRKGDRILAINDVPVTDMADLRLVTWDKEPGDIVSLKILRQRWFLKPQELTYEIELR